MFLAPNIYSELVCGYTRDYDLKEYANDAVLSAQVQKNKDTSKPESVYHTWIMNNGMEYSRNKIIVKLLQEETDKKVQVAIDSKTPTHVHTADNKISTQSVTNNNVVEIIVKDESDTESVYSSSEHEQEDKRKDAHKNDNNFNENEDTDSEDGSDDTLLQHEIANSKLSNNKLYSDKDIDNMFINLASLNWMDKDVNIMNIHVLRKINNDTLFDMYIIMKCLSDNLYGIISPITGALDDMTEENKYNFLFHLLAQGKDLYLAVLDEPEFCLYLLDQYQPLYEFMKKRLNI